MRHIWLSPRQLPRGGKTPYAPSGTPTAPASSPPHRPIGHDLGQSRVPAARAPAKRPHAPRATASAASANASPPHADAPPARQNPVRPEQSPLPRVPTRAPVPRSVNARPILGVGLTEERPNTIRSSAERPHTPRAVPATRPQPSRPHTPSRPGHTPPGLAVHPKPRGKTSCTVRNRRRHRRERTNRLSANATDERPRSTRKADAIPRPLPANAPAARAAPPQPHTPRGLPRNHTKH